MKKLFVLFSTMPSRAIYLVISVFIIFLLQGCGCESYCGFWGRIVRNQHSCVDECLTDPESYLSKRYTGTDKKNDQPADTNATTVNPAPQNKPARPGEYYATTILAGASTSFMNGAGESDYFKSKPGTGFQIGIGNAFPLNHQWGITSSIRFKQTTGAQKLSYPGSSSDYKTTYTYSYVSGTIMPQCYLSRRLSITAGPEVNYLLGATMKPGGGGDKENIKKESTTVGIDLLAGFKYEIPMGKGRSKWGLSLIYDHRLSKLNKEDNNNPGMSDYHMKSIQLGVSYFICNCGKNNKQK